MNSPQTCVSQQALVSRGSKYTPAAGDIKPQIDNTPGPLHRKILRGENLRWPFGAIIDTVRPIAGNPVQMRADGLQPNHHLCNGVLDLGMVRHGARESDRVLAPHGSNAFVES